MVWKNLVFSTLFFIDLIFIPRFYFSFTYRIWKVVVVIRKLKFWNWLKYTGLWIPLPLTTIIILGTIYVLPFFEVNVNFIVEIFICTLLIPLLIWNKNSIAKMNGKVNFPILPSQTGTDPEYQYSYRTKALNRKVTSDLLQKVPKGIVFGKSANKYVCINPGEKGASHTLVLGPSGSGKTSSVLGDSILASYINKDNSEITWVVVDVKGELEEKFFPTDTKLAVFSPRDRSRQGFDCLYDINDESGEYEVLTTLRRVIYSLIPTTNLKSGETFWTDGPRSILQGIWLYGWMNLELRTLPDLVDFTLSKNLKTLINEILTDVDNYSNVSKLLTPFGGEDAADETISSLSMNIGNALYLLATDETLRYLMRECPDKITPEILEQGVSVDIQIKDEFLQDYSKILSLIIGTFCTAMTRRPEGSKQICMVLDELGRIAHEGQIEGLQSVLQIGRSRGVSVICCLQSWSAMETVYPEGACKDMLNNFPYRLILQAQPDSKDVTEMVIKAFGKYTEKKRSYTNSKQKSYTYSFEEKDVIQERDLLVLPEQNKVVLLSPYGAYRLQKLQYYKDSILGKKAEEIKDTKNL